jgi:tRNA-dihydrouridine synthase B
LIKPLQLGNKLFPINIIQGPLAGISCAPFRLLTWRYSQPAFSCTEMISGKTLMSKPTFLQQRFIIKDPAEGPVCFQLASSNPQELAETTKRVTAYGADIIDLNCGCPVKKIRSKGAGSRLLTDASKLYQLICAMKQNTHVPVSIKIRVEGRSNEKFHQEIVKAVQDAGADFLVVHGRHWTEHYETSCHYAHIKYFVEALKIPVIGNGDVRCSNSLKEMFATGCAGVMISRAGVGQPWLIRQLIAEFNHEPFRLPLQKEIGLMFIEHVKRLAALLNNEKLAVLQARQFAKYYGRNIENRANFCEEINSCTDMNKFAEVVSYYFH